MWDIVGWAWWDIAKLKLSHELERGGIYLQKTYEIDIIYKHKNIDHFTD